MLTFYLTLAVALVVMGLVLAHGVGQLVAEGLIWLLHKISAQSQRERPRT